MASLKHNGTELARKIYTSTSNEGMTVYDHVSWGSRGWILRKREIVFQDDHRVKGHWKRWRRWDKTHDVQLSIDATDRWYHAWEGGVNERIAVGQ